METLLSTLYNDPATGFISARKLYEKAKAIDSSIRLEDVKDWYAQQIDIQRHQEQKSSLPQFKIASYNPNSWQIDLAFWRKRTMLTAININSRIGYAQLIPDKKATSVLKVLEAFVKAHKVDIITSDNGKKFLNDSVQTYLQEKNIEHYNNEAGDHNTMGKIERFNRTLKQRLIKIDKPLTKSLLSDVIKNYNSTFHSAINATPNQMKGKVMEEDIKYNQDLNRDVTNELNIGDNVLYRLKKGKFDKEAEKWSKTIYQIVGIDGYKI